MPFNVSKNLPNEIALLIFKELDIGAATCLGLTCRQFYRCLKTFHPGPIRLTKECILYGWEWEQSFTIFPFCHHRHSHKHTIRCAIMHWIGPQYRYGHEMDSKHCKFLKKSVYGDEPPTTLPRRPHGKKSRGKQFARYLLSSRYRDYDRAAIAFLPRGQSPIFQPPDSCKSLLPSPFNLGEKWDDLALDIMKNDLRNSKDLAARRAIWGRFSIYGRKREEIENFIDTIKDVSGGIQLLSL